MRITSARLSAFKALRARAYRHHAPRARRGTNPGAGDDGGRAGIDPGAAEDRAAGKHLLCRPCKELPQTIPAAKVEQPAESLLRRQLTIR